MVEDAVVVARADAAGENRLVAYVVPKSGVQVFRYSGVQGDPVAAPEPPITISTLRRELAGRLPEPMIPSALVLLETLPRTVTGKVDRRALPAPSYSLKASQVISRVVQAFGVQLPVSRFLETPTVEAMAVLIAESLAEQAGAEDVRRILQEG
jgi:hypothetical protein